MKQLCLHSLTPKICLLILSSSCYTFPCTFVIGIFYQVKITTSSLLFQLDIVWMFQGEVTILDKAFIWFREFELDYYYQKSNGQPIIRYNIRQGSPQVGETLPSEMQKNSPMPKVAQKSPSLIGTGPQVAPMITTTPANMYSR